MKFIDFEADRNMQSIQVIGVNDTDVFCIFLGKVWKMKTPKIPIMPGSASDLSILP